MGRLSWPLTKMDRKFLEHLANFLKGLFVEDYPRILKCINNLEPPFRVEVRMPMSLFKRKRSLVKVEGAIHLFLLDNQYIDEETAVEGMESCDKYGNRFQIFSWVLVDMEARLDPARLH